MPNGKPGDHPYTDIIIHDTEVYNGEVSRIVKHIDGIEDSGATNRARHILWDAGEELSKEDLDRLTHDLYTLTAELRLADDYSQDTPLEACLENNDAVFSAEIRELVRRIDNEIDEEEKNIWWARPTISAILWEFGWETNRLDELESRLHEFRKEKIRE